MNTNTNPRVVACEAATVIGSASSALVSMSRPLSSPASETAQPCRKVRLPGMD